MIVILGLWDDVKRIPPRNKILGQVIAAIILLKGGVGSHCLDPLIEPHQHPLPDRIGANAFSCAAPIIDILSWSFVVRLVVGCCNATNLMDGLDGLVRRRHRASSPRDFYSWPSSLPCSALSRIGMPCESSWRIALLGAVLGFVPYNFNPASIFMGDTGSMFIGYSCATLIILLAQEQAKWLLAAMVMFALPILDTALAFVRRWVNRRPLFSADRYHLHHQLVARGYSVRKTVVISYGLAIGFCLLGMLIVYMRTRYAIAFYLVIFGSLIVAAYKMGLVHENTAGGQPQITGLHRCRYPRRGQSESPVVELPDAPDHPSGGESGHPRRPRDRSPEDQSTGAMTPRSCRDKRPHMTIVIYRANRAAENSSPVSSKSCLVLSDLILQWNSNRTCDISMIGSPFRPLSRRGNYPWT